ncbi:MAG: UDP-N-acetylmuramate dehydrogenase [Eubacteriales bacterium]|nr:UDP-N-acetylmuramate dehydrogenase [Eubacteriales bacterium]MDD3881422.1 UDP-N-acetylmuramate dehydrogenase [Eubacteriales bacterium]
MTVFYHPRNEKVNRLRMIMSILSSILSKTVSHGENICYNICVKQMPEVLMPETLYQKIAQIAPDRTIKNAPMSACTTFRIGGSADVLFSPKSESEIISAIETAKSLGAPYIVIGQGSNLLVSGEGIEGLVVRLEKPFSSVEMHDGCICAQAGATMISLARFALEQGLAGLEFAHGIPGSVGGGVYMNAGAYGGEISQVLKSARCLMPDGRIIELSLEDMRLSYRKSRLMDEGGTVLSAKFALSSGDKDEIKEKMDDFARRRREKQPLQMPSAGSTFKRPEGYFAGGLIEKAGLKGYSVGGAAVSDMHAGFLVNKSGASCADMLLLISHVRKAVHDISGVWLEPEVRIIGRGLEGGIDDFDKMKS